MNCGFVCSRWSCDNEYLQLAKDIISAFSKSTSTPLCIILTAYSMKFESQGSIIGPERVTPYSSSAIRRRLMNISLLRHAKGIINRLLYDVQTTIGYLSWPRDPLPAGRCYPSPFCCELNRLLCADHVLLYLRMRLQQMSKSQK